jgi:hypothetical protein
MWFFGAVWMFVATIGICVFMHSLDYVNHEPPAAEVLQSPTAAANASADKPARVATSGATETKADSLTRDFIATSSIGKPLCGLPAGVLYDLAMYVMGLLQ